ncbi:MAG: thioredoxin family protein [Desulfovibrio sp.]|jgi:thiol:disulfide interchange protein DsbD|nr:thioredoxin family protein [Desulfovibrio sp.]
MKRFLGLLLLLSCLCGQAWAGQAACLLVWQGFFTPGEEEESRQPAGSPGRGEASSSGAILAAFTLIPPQGMYHYGPDSPEGTPTAVTVVYAPVSPFADRPEPGGRAFQALLREKGVTLPVRLPPARPAKDALFASPAGKREDTVPIFTGPLTFWTRTPAITPFYRGAALRVTVTGLLCSASFCAPFENSRDLLLDAYALRTFPSAADQAWWPEFLAGSAVQLTVPEDAARDAAASGEPAGTAWSRLPEAPASPEKAQPEEESFAAVVSGLEPGYLHPSLEVEDLGEAVLFGLLAGLLLNLMPCVLPVISLKFTSLMAVNAREDQKDRARIFQTHCLLFSAGILAWFAVLALLLGTAGWAWGEIFQSPEVVFLLGLILFLLGLSLFGVFTLPVLDLKTRGEGNPRLQAFFSGLLATLLATPCSGPLLGGVLGWALRQPLAILMLAIGSVGLGMTLPYVLLALRPGLVNLLPRPGPWTLRLEQLLGFFLLGSVVYLASLLPDSWVISFLFLLLCLALAAWLWGQIGHPGASRLRRWIARAAAILLLAGGLWWGKVVTEEDFAWEEFDPVVFVRDLGKEPLLLEFTADWCPSCKAMEHTTLSGKRMTALRNRYKMRTIKVDLTRENPAAKRLLIALGSGSIPVIALFPPGEAASRPLVLRDIITPAQLEDALAQTF